MLRNLVVLKSRSLFRQCNVDSSLMNRLCVSRNMASLAQPENQNSKFRAAFLQA